VLELCPLGHQLRPRALDSLSWALILRFRQCGNIDDLDECIQFSREAVSLCPEGHAGRDTFLNNLALSLNVRFDHQGKPNDLDEAISLYEEALRLRPVGHKYRDTSLSNLGLALIARFKGRGNIDDITRAVSLYREALTLRPPGHPRRDTTLNNLALALKIRYDKLDVSEDLNEAIDRYRESLRLRRLDHPERHRNLFNLSAALCSRFTQTQENGDVEEAINLCQESFEALPLLHPDRHTSYFTLGKAYTARYCAQYKPADLALAVENFRLASRHPTQGFPRRIIAAIEWACQSEVYQHESALEAYQTCFELFDNHVMTRSSIISRREASTAFEYARTLPVDAASCAIRCDDLRHAVELVEQGRAQQWSLASRLKTPVEDLELANPTLAHKYLELSKRISNAAQSSATITDRAAADRAATEYRRSTRQWKAAVAEIRKLRAFSRFLLPPLYEDLQAAARHGPVIILIASEYSRSAIIVPTALDSLSWALGLRFTQCGNIDDLDECIQFSREAVSLFPEGHAGRDTYLNNLAFSLTDRLDHQGKPNDLDEAISLYEEALRLRPVGHESRDTSLDNLGGALVTRFNACGNVDDITRAVSLYREALTLRPPGHPYRDITLNNLALALKTRYDKLDVSEDLNEAVGRYRESLQLKRLHDPERHRTLFNLSAALCSRFTQARENGDVEEAIQLCQEALASLPSLHPGRCRVHLWLQEAYLSRYRIQHNPVDLSLAVENFRLGSRHPTYGFPERIDEAYNWTVAAEQHGHGSALEAYSTFFELLDAHLATRSSATSRREAAAAFHYARSLPVDAASCAIRCDDLRYAVELVEKGRGQQWSLASRLRTPVEDLESANPKLAHNYSELSKRVSDAAQSSAAIADRAAADRAATEYRGLTRQWEAAVTEIRNLRAFSRFLLPPSYKDLQRHHRPDVRRPPSPSLAIYRSHRSEDSQGSLHQGNTKRICYGPKAAAK
ncbi:hypothetical protein BDR05DRAFT_1003340, partial [Suillus weaverae]